MSDPMFRVYGSEELGEDGYPFAWHRCTECGGWGYWDHARLPESDVRVPCEVCEGSGSIKQHVRDMAGNRCLRCGHPYKVGESGEWDNPAHGPGTVRRTRQLGIPMEEAESAAGPMPSLRATLWSDCDARCTHAEPLRVVYGDGHAEPMHAPSAGDGVVLIDWLASTGRIPEGSRVQAAWRVLTVHHLNEQKNDCRWHNLLALCQRCHLLVQRKVDVERPWLSEHSGWFKPFVAGFYASKYEGREISRAEAEERMDELLAHEHLLR